MHHIPNRINNPGPIITDEGLLSIHRGRNHYAGITDTEDSCISNVVKLDDLEYNDSEKEKIQNEFKYCVRCAVDTLRYSGGI